MLTGYFQRCNEKPQVINDYEAGRGIPNQAVIGKIERALGMYLTVLHHYKIIAVRNCNTEH